jgi:AhpD family alkylhydroperoxidase
MRIKAIRIAADFFAQDYRDIRLNTNKLKNMKTTEQRTVTLEVYDPAMCCSTGVCGPDLDDKLVAFANNAKWLKSLGIEVNRHNLGQEPDAFKANQEVIARLQSKGSGILPILVVNGAIVSEGKYPNREQLKELLNISAEPSLSKDTDQDLITEQVQELIALAASLASNCESLLKYHFEQAKDLDISNQNIAQTLQIALDVKQLPTENIVDVANKLLGVKKEESCGCAPGGSCC